MYIATFTASQHNYSQGNQSLSWKSQKLHNEKMLGNNVEILQKSNLNYLSPRKSLFYIT